MKARSKLGAFWASFLRLVLSVPIYFKILGIGALVAVLFGAVTLYQVRKSLVSRLFESNKQATLTLALSLSARLERPMTVRDLFSVYQELRETLENFEGVRYIIVQDDKGKVVAHTFTSAVPSDLLRSSPREISGKGEFQILESAEGLIFDASMPILGGHAGLVRVGVTDQMMAREVASITRSILITLVICMVIGQGLALALTYVLTRPLHRLVLVARRIQKGEFETREEVIAEDEIGKLTEAFNQMAEGLQKYRHEVLEKEKARLALIEKIVFAQEEERKRIARDLHDQLGQSLLALLLALQASDKERNCPPCLAEDIELRVRRLIDEVRRLAWEIRPSLLDDYGLEVALERYIEEAKKRFEMELDYQCTSSSHFSRLPGQVEVTLYRIAQEAITNIVRHACARHASVVLIRQEHEVKLLIEDDGVGFDMSALHRNGGKCLGILGIKERVSLVGGDFALESTPGKGTSLRIRIPLEGEAGDGYQGAHR